MAKTYDPIATQTLGSTATSVTFSSISGAYTDLVVVVSAASGASGYYAAIQLNGDTASAYTYTNLNGNGTTAARTSSPSPNTVMVFDGNEGFPVLSSVGTLIFNVMNYANTTTFKSVLGRFNNSTRTSAVIGRWSSTAAVNSITILPDTASRTSFSIGSVFSLYGIKAA